MRGVLSSCVQATNVFAMCVVIELLHDVKLQERLSEEYPAAQSDTAKLCTRTVHDERSSDLHKTKPNVLEDRRSSPRTPVASKGSSCRKRQAVTRPPDLQCGAEKSQAVAEPRRPMLARRHCCARSSGRRSAQSRLALLSRAAAWPHGNLA